MTTIQTAINLPPAGAAGLKTSACEGLNTQEDSSRPARTRVHAERSAATHQSSCGFEEIRPLQRGSELSCSLAVWAREINVTLKATVCKLPTDIYRPVGTQTEEPEPKPSVQLSLLALLYLLFVTCCAEGHTHSLNSAELPSCSAK